MTISLAAVVQHIQILEDSGLIHTTKNGRVRTCEIEPAALNVAERWACHLGSTWERRFQRLETTLAEEEP